MSEEDDLQVAASREAEGKIRQIERGDLKDLMSTPSGRRLMWKWLSLAAVFHNGFDRDPYVHAFNAGQRNFGNRLLVEIHDVCPDLFVVMQREAVRIT